MTRAGYDDTRTRDVLGIVGVAALLGALGTVALALNARLTLEAPHIGARADQGSSGMPARWTRTPRDHAELRAWLSERLRPKPDARLSLALEALRRIRALPTATVTTRFVDDRWNLSVDDRPAAQLSVDADFDELLVAVTAEARRLPPLAAPTAPAPEAIAWPSFTPSRDATTSVAPVA